MSLRGPEHAPVFIAWTALAEDPSSVPAPTCGDSQPGGMMLSSGLCAHYTHVHKTVLRHTPIQVIKYKNKVITFNVSFIFI